MSSRNSSPAGSAVTRLGRNCSSRNSTDVKSSGFYPTSMSPTARMTIVEHMDSHYKRLQRVKAVVDTTPPKSYQLSRSPSPSRSSANSSRPNSRSSLRTNGSQYTPVDRQQVLQSTNKINFYLEAMRREQQRLFSQLAAPNFRRIKSSNNSVSVAVTTNKMKHNDIIEKHSQNFTSPERPFVPRVLKTNAKSKLRENRWYNPPRRKELKRSDSNEEFDEYAKDWEDDFSDRSVSTPVRKITSKESKDDESIRDSKTYFSRWLDEQVYASEHRRKVLSKTSNNELEQSINTSPLRLNKAEMSSQIRKAATPKSEDSLPYLQFIVDVTNDILIRGVYTNKVLKQVFASHLERRKHELKMDQMETALKQLQIDLGITVDDDDYISSHSFGYGRRPSINNGYKKNSQTSVEENSLKSLSNGNTAVTDAMRMESASEESVRSADRGSFGANGKATISGVSSVKSEGKIPDNASQVSNETYDKETFESESESEKEFSRGDEDVESLGFDSKQYSDKSQHSQAKKSRDSPVDDFY
ncbi:Spermatoproteinsis associated 7 [Chamberlinius hualienensis]